MILKGTREVAAEMERGIDVVRPRRAHCSIGIATVSLEIDLSHDARHQMTSSGILDVRFTLAT
jgi:hypothetical protein